MVPAIIPVALSKKRQHLIQAFMKAEATSPERASTLAELGLSPSLMFEIQKLKHVFVAVTAERFYLDLEKARKDQRTRIIAAGVIGIAVLAAALYFNH